MGFTGSEQNKLASRILLLTRRVLLVLLQDSDPLVQSVVGDSGPVVPTGAVVVLDPAALPLQRSDAGRGRRRQADDGGEKHVGQSVHDPSVHWLRCRSAAAYGEEDPDVIYKIRAYV